MMGSDADLEQNWEEFDFSDYSPTCREVPDTQLLELNRRLESLPTEDRVSWALENLPASHVLSSSFGAQAAVGIHLLTRQDPKIPVILIDTGYLFPETYRFIDELSESLSLNLQVFRSPLSTAWQEARYGRRWQANPEGLAAYNQEVKVEPMKRALSELDVGTWYVGLRRDQSPTRANTPLVQRSGGRFKVHPIADWTDRDVHRYPRSHNLPYHPLWDKGYVSIGDHHTTRPLHEVDHVLDTRFFGMKRECGLHEFDFAAE